MSHLELLIRKKSYIKKKEANCILNLHHFM